MQIGMLGSLEGSVPPSRSRPPRALGSPLDPARHGPRPILGRGRTPPAGGLRPHGGPGLSLAGSRGVCTTQTLASRLSPALSPKVKGQEESLRHGRPGVPARLCLLKGG